MNKPSRTLVNWIALGLIVLFIWILLAAIIAPRLRESAAGAGDLDVTQTSPSVDATTTALYAATPTALFWALPAGALITTEQVGQIPAGARVQVMHVSYTPDGWVYSIAALDGSAMADARENQLTLDPTFDPGQPTAVPRYFDAVYWSECYPLMLTEDIAIDPPNLGISAVPAGTRVRISSYSGVPMYVEGHGYVYQYDVATMPDSGWSSAGINTPSLSVLAYEYQLAPAEGEIIVEGVPTPTSPFEIGVYGAAYITTEDVADIPAGTNVSIGSAHLSCDHWVYDISTEDGRYAQARQDQLTYDPSFTPGPTPTYPLTWTPTPTPAALAGSTPDPRFVTLAGTYGCQGTEFGMLAGAGTLFVYADGTFEYRDYYPGDPTLGHLAWTSETELDVVEDMDILSIIVTSDTTLHVTVIEGTFTHTDEGYLNCTEV